MKPRVLQDAETELLAATLWYEEKQEGLGTEFSNQVLALIALIGKEPLRFAFYEGKRLKRKLRRALLERFPYVVIFEIRDTEILIVAIAHTSRQPGFWQSRKPNK